MKAPIENLSARRRLAFAGFLVYSSGRVLYNTAMISGLAILAIGFFLGMRHATDPDHVIAVSTIVSRERSLSKAALIGALWGLGHTITIVLVGAAIILFNVVIPPRLGLTMEFAVGLMLILLGVLNLSGVTKWLSEKFSPAHPHISGEHAHLHEHNSHVHYHWHSHAPSREHHADFLPPPRWLGNAVSRLGLFHSLRPLLVGLVHGLAGSAAVALLVLGTIRDPRWGVFYLLIFGVGTIAGMMLITVALALPFSFAGTRFGWLNRGLIVGSGVLSLLFGLYISYHIGIVDGLFTSHPSWTPS
jgi:ABC-type nickel/cobalt efflux system permease component RcnA